MPESTLTSSRDNESDQASIDFYRHVVKTLTEERLPFLVGGAYAFTFYTGISRHSKDFDIFIRREDYARISDALKKVGYTTDLAYPHWLAKIHLNGDYVDIIFSSGNGVADVDPTWFDHAPEADVLDMRVKLCPAEEMIWSKAFVMERERYDGADVAHLFRACGNQIDWSHLLRRFGEKWRVLFSHMILFGLIFPDHRHVIPNDIMEELIERLQREMRTDAACSDVCGGTLLSREQYLIDLERWGYRDGRLGHMSEVDIARWTEAINKPH
ncbi:MAG: nucleotidyltransferase [Burkholderiales bacterium]|nr:nucleotidyltransferase [Burkholderiales bacterium]